MMHTSISEFPRVRALTLLFILIVVLTTVDLAAGELAGHWNGAFSRLGAIQEVQIELQETSSGWVGHYSIPDLILYREPLRELEVHADTINFRLFWGKFECLLHNEVREITGGNINWKPPVSIHLKASPDRAPIQIEDVQFSSGTLSLAGHLLLPPGNPPYPCVVVIEGSTAEGRGLWSYRSIGDMFVRNGIAALIYDKRGTGGSSGNFDQTTFEDLEHDVGAAVKFVYGRNDIDSKSIGLFGISQGGWLAPLVALKSDQVSFCILLGGPAVSIWDQELDRVEYSMRAGALSENDPDVFTDQQIADALGHTRLGFQAAIDTSLWGAWEASVASAGNQPWSAYVGLDSALTDLQGWLRYRYDPESTLTSIKKPVLAIFGQNDVLVPPKVNVPLMESYLSQAGNNQSHIVIFPGVGHDFFAGASLVGNDWEWPTGFWRWNRRAVGLEDTIVNWTKAQVQHDSN